MNTQNTQAINKNETYKGKETMNTIVTIEDLLKSISEFEYEPTPMKTCYCGSYITEDFYRLTLYRDALLYSLKYFKNVNFNDNNLSIIIPKRINRTALKKYDLSGAREYEDHLLWQAEDFLGDSRILNQFYKRFEPEYSLNGQIYLCTEGCLIDLMEEIKWELKGKIDNLNIKHNIYYDYYLQNDCYTTTVIKVETEEKTFEIEEIEKLIHFLEINLNKNNDKFLSIFKY